MFTATFYFNHFIAIAYAKVVIGDQTGQYRIPFRGPEISKIGEEEKAKVHFDRLLSYSNPLGLFSEDIDFKSKRLLGNFPQAYSHLALIEGAINFSRKASGAQIMGSIKI